jgi:ligand-binding SRPBCC domain-containing protein
MHQLHTTTLLKAPLEKVWDFFSSPQNLKKITPAAMGFHIIMGGNTKMYPGQIIAYKVKPLLGIPTLWVTEITHVEPNRFFVDEQRIGPYKMWHHEHHFEPVEGGVKMTDIVSYRLPFGILGKLVNWLFVGKKVAGIFKYREQVIGQFFEVE